jgi:hypothetical protein
VDVADPDQVGPEVSATVAALRDWLSTVDPAVVADRLRARLWPSDRPAPIRPLAQAAFLSALDADSVVTVRPGLRWRLVPAGHDRVELRTFDRTLTMPAGCAPALRWLLSGKPRRVGDAPGFDEPADALVLARRLLREAVLVAA